MRTRANFLGTVTVLLLVPALAGAAVVTLPLTQAWQHKDTNMNCLAGCGPVAHPANHAAPPGCFHCGSYCAPASISMYAQYRGRIGVLTQQDFIYDMGKSTGGEITANGVLETHGLGMFDVGPPNGPAAEVQAAFQFAVGAPWQWGPVAYGMPAMTGGMIILCIDDNIPILWCDHWGFPSEQFPLPPENEMDFLGHCKVIAGYDDKDTADFADDDYFIYDPWPTSGSPYWVGNAAVLDVRDVYLTDYHPVPTEETSWGQVKNLYR